MAEGQGFEPWMGDKPMPVFKTGAFNRSAIPPSEERIISARWFFVQSFFIGRKANARESFMGASLACDATIFVWVRPLPKLWCHPPVRTSCTFVAGVRPRGFVRATTARFHLSAVAEPEYRRRVGRYPVRVLGRRLLIRCDSNRTITSNRNYPPALGSYFRIKAVSRVLRHGRHVAFAVVPIARSHRNRCRGAFARRGGERHHALVPLP